ncbi:MAG: exodeoxyribonuclease III [Methylobacteriaceae bacterium]|nr:exodeoxyribonuclease III [Methylobacteriaceae bacterium]
MAKNSCKIATWNINSVRLRMPIVARYLREHGPDVLCLQETKCRDSEFPFSAFRELGYEHIEIHGQKGYHGVAIASRRPLTESRRRDFCGKGDARHLCVGLKIGARTIELHNFYVPAGGDEPDPQINPKFAHKLAFFDELADWAREERTNRRDTVLVGDINVAPLETDVWSHKALLKVVSHTPIEVERFEAARRAGHWVDAMREFVPADQRLYTWWSYRSPDWEKADKGRRLDHIWVSPSLADSLANLHVLKEARGWERPSDHVPVSIEIAG